MKISAVPHVQGQTEITCSSPNEKQTEGLKEVTRLFVLCTRVFCRVAWGRGEEWCHWVLWLPHISSKAYFIFIVPELRCVVTTHSMVGVGLGVEILESVGFPGSF